MYKQVETHRGVVYPWMIDHVGHMNVQFYTARFDEATWQFLAQLGLTPSFLKRNHRSAVAVEQRTQYKRELIAGALIHITTELVSLGRSSIRFLHRMHWKDLRALDETEQRLYSLAVWRECPWYTERERAALSWAEAVTFVATGHVPDAVHAEVRPHFNDTELADLTMAVAAINAWNRLSIAARLTPGTYKSALAVAAAT